MPGTDASMTESKPRNAILEPAATLILLRPAAAGTEVFMQVRHRDMAFAGGALVFPGGKQEAEDSDPALTTLIDDRRRDDALMAAKRAAIRETFEECGLMLAHPLGCDALASGAWLQRLDAERERLHRGEQSFAALLERESLQPACDRLVHFAHWLTPDFMPRRFDTHFFLAAAPAFQDGTHNGHEATESVWIQPEEAITAAAQGRYKMLFPTRSILHRLCGAHTPDYHLRVAAATPVITVAPCVIQRGADAYVQIPDNIGYELFEEQITRR